MAPVIIPRSGHPVSRRDIDPHALKVLYRLYRAGHVAYLVGGGVRDLLLGIRPKDFDVATDAHPARMKKLFRNCFLVGRRFRLAHVRFGQTVIEVSTFRRAPETTPEGDLLIRHDNTFGTPEDDALRRDFTINALFYDIGTFAIIDYVGGLGDVEDHVVRSIGDPNVRYQEDPVRMLRAVKFAARLGFEIVEEDREAITVHREKIQQAAVPRVLEEIFKLLRGGAAAPSFKLMADMGLLHQVLPEIAEHLERIVDEESPERAELYRMLFALDRLAAKPLRHVEPTNSLLLAACFLPLLAEYLREEAGTEGPWSAGADDVEEGIEEVVEPVLRRFTVSRRDSDRLRRCLLAQRRLAAAAKAGAKGRQRQALERQAWFHEAVALLRMSARVHEDLRPLAKLWARRAREVPPVEERRPPQRRRRRRPPR